MERKRNAASLWYLDNLARAVTARQDYYLKHSEATRQRNRDWARANPERKAATDRAWRLSNRDRRRAAEDRRRAQKYGSRSEPYDRRDVFARDEWTCQLCNVAIDRTLDYPDMMSLSVDHIIPLCHGGDDSFANVQAAHLRCNLSKGKRILK